MNIMITRIEKGIKRVEIYDNLDKASVRYRNLNTEIYAGRLNCVVEIDLITIDYAENTEK